MLIGDQVRTMMLHNHHPGPGAGSKSCLSLTPRLIFSCAMTLIRLRRSSRIARQRTRLSSDDLGLSRSPGGMHGHSKPYLSDAGRLGSRLRSARLARASACIQQILWWLGVIILRRARLRLCSASTPRGMAAACAAWLWRPRAAVRLGGALMFPGGSASPMCVVTLRPVAPSSRLGASPVFGKSTRRSPLYRAIVPTVPAVT